jgi:KUP system potassium uptake protein
MRSASPTLQAAGPAALMVGALGVVFGDIGTSPLYAMQAALAAEDRPLTREDVYGPVSLVFWTVTLIVTVKYVTFIMRADNDGEGGVMALIALVQRTGARGWILALGAFGAALFYGDGMITPAISVLSAVEGLKVAAPAVGSLSVPIALVLLFALFGVQRFGTGAVGRLFGPVMIVWFATIALAGLRQVVEYPGILEALSPTYGVTFFAEHGSGALVVLGSVVLTVTGAEALYADLGHFGRTPIRRDWLLLVFPALMLNYAGQGALVLTTPAAIENPFFHLVPEWGRLPMVALATAATVIASQAVISGAFSITHQAVQLGFLPRVTIRHTSEREHGQVYAPVVNWILCVAVAGLVVGFGSSAHLAAAYGIAVTGTMVITTVLFLFVVRRRWDWSPPLALATAAVFLSVDLTLFGASLTKLPHGGWLPLAVASGIFLLLMTWRTGRDALARALAEREGPLRAFVEEVRRLEPPVFRAPGTAVFLHTNRDTAPIALRANLEFNHVLHRSVVIVVIETTEAPHVDPRHGVRVDDLGYRDDGITHIIARFGFRDRHDVPRAVALAAARGLEQPIDVQRASFFISRIAAVPPPGPTPRAWQKRLFIALLRNEADPTWYYALPDERTAIMGALVDL